MSHQLSAASQALMNVLTKYQNHVNQLGFSVDFYKVNFLDIRWRPRESLVEVQKSEKSIGGKIPTELAEIWMELGAFDLPYGNDWNTLSISSSEGISKPLAKGLIHAITENWGDRPEITESLSAEQINEINENFFCFGIYTHDDNRHSYLCFDKNGHSDIFSYDQDHWDEFADDVIHGKLLAKVQLKKSATDVLSEIIEVLMKSLTLDHSEFEDSLDKDSEKFRLELSRPDLLSAFTPHANAGPTTSATANTATQLSAALQPFLEGSDPEGVFAILRDWPNKDAIWVQFAKNRMIAPSCTPEQRSVLQKLILERGS